MINDDAVPFIGHVGKSPSPQYLFRIRMIEIASVSMRKSNIRIEVNLISGPSPTPRTVLGFYHALARTRARGSADNPTA